MGLETSRCHSCFGRYILQKMDKNWEGQVSTSLRVVKAMLQDIFMFYKILFMP